MQSFKKFPSSILIFIMIFYLNTFCTATEETSNSSEDSNFKVDFINADKTVINSNSENFIEYELKLTNNGDNTLRNFTTSINRRDALNSITEFQDNQLLVPEEFNKVNTAVQNQNIDLKPKSSKNIKIKIGITKQNPSQENLDISKPGIYPLLINIQTQDNNGQNIYRGKKILLPVFNIPDSKNANIQKISNTTATTFIWPMAAEKNLISAPTGMGITPHLINKDLGEIFTKKGWLGSSTFEIENQLTVNPTNTFFKSLYIAIDPSLLITAKYISGKYDVLENPLDPLGKTYDGSFSKDAVDWINSIKRISKKVKIIPLPFGATEISTLQNLNKNILTKRALFDGKKIIDDILETKSIDDYTISPSGYANSEIVNWLINLNKNKIIFSDKSIENFDKNKDQTKNILSNETELNSYDHIISETFSKIGKNDDFFSSIQNALSLLYFQNKQEYQIIYPGTDWTPNGNVTKKIFKTLEELFAVNLISPANLEYTQSTKTNKSLLKDYTFTDNVYQLSDLEMKKNRDLVEELQLLYNSLESVPNTPINRESFLSPVTDNFLRGFSTLYDGPNNTFNLMSEYFIGLIKSKVTLISPGEKYTLASEKSKIPLVIENKLPIRIKIKLNTEAPNGVRVTIPESVTIPSNNSLQVNIPIESDQKNYLKINFNIKTSSGLALGNNATVNIKSNAYGNSLIFFALLLGFIILILSIRKLWRRFRNKNTAKNVMRTNIKDVFNKK